MAGEKSRDAEIWEQIAAEIGVNPAKATLDEAGRVIELNLGFNQLQALPPEIGQLSNLTKLDLWHNDLQALPPEIGQLSSLIHLNLSTDDHLPVMWNNHLQALPPEIGQLSSLTHLDVENNRLQVLPPEIGQLSNLTYLNLAGNRLQALPPEIGQLSNLSELDLSGNRLQALPPEIGQLSNLTKLILWETHLKILPPEIGQLSNLTKLTLGNGIGFFSRSSNLPELPPEIRNLTKLRSLNLANSELQTLPPETWRLSSLTTLNISHNQLQALPSEIGQLSNLSELDLSGNRLQALPPEIRNLTKLRSLNLANNELQTLPPETWRLSSLTTLNISHNQLQALPSEIGQLSNLSELRLEDNPLQRLPYSILELRNMQYIALSRGKQFTWPPVEITERGSLPVLEYVWEIQKEKVDLYEAKLLIVGQGGTGKTALKEILEGRDHIEGRTDSTEGIDISAIQVEHPDLDVKIKLNLWDFGGQDIYRVTDQFFLTNRSLYLLVWHARQQAQQSNLTYWLEAIRVLAPNAPVILVATHIDKYDSRLNYAQYKANYPQIVDFVSINNLTKEGLPELLYLIKREAAKLPQMGEPWPKKWRALADTLAARTEHHIDEQEYLRICEEMGIERDLALGTLGHYLHDLGKILYYPEDDQLSNLVVLKPNWITKAIGKVLNDKHTRENEGILNHEWLPIIWHRDETGIPYSRHLYPAFLRLMEKYDLSYRIDPSSVTGYAATSLVPELLPYQPSDDKMLDWAPQPSTDENQVELIYQFKMKVMPYGIMSRFIVRTHRYTERAHWRDGVFLQYRGQCARVELNESETNVRLTVRGSTPTNFFATLKDTMDAVVERFEQTPGVVIRKVPCICSNRTCSESFKYESLLEIEKAGQPTIQCIESREHLSVRELLYGIKPVTDDEAMKKVQEIANQITTAITNQGAELVSEIRHVGSEVKNIGGAIEDLQHTSEQGFREFTRKWNLLMKKMDLKCPNLIVLNEIQGIRINPRNWFSQKYHLHLLCQHPSNPHLVGEPYEFDESREWWRKVSPWLRRLIKLLRISVPIGVDAYTLVDETTMKAIESSTELLEEIVDQLPELDSKKRGSSDESEIDTLADGQGLEGAALRVLDTLLRRLDPNTEWRGLTDTDTPDGNLLWLCEKHRKEYVAGPVNLGTA